LFVLAVGLRCDETLKKVFIDRCACRHAAVWTLVLRHTFQNILDRSVQERRA